MSPVPSSVPGPAAAPVRHDYLDALRGWAILGVLAVHSAFRIHFPFPGDVTLLAGQYGVQLFFMVSAFTIFLTLDRADPAGGRPRWGEFFIRRFCRVLPMFWVGIVLYAPVQRLLEPAAPPPSLLAYGLAATLQQGWHPRLIDSVVPGGWSIAVEGTFYLLVPLLHRAVRTWQAALWLLLGSLALSAAVFDVSVPLYKAHRLFSGVPVNVFAEFLYHFFPFQLPVFACGILVYQLDRIPGGKHAGAVLLAAAAVAGCQCIGVGMHGWLREHDFFALAFVLLMLGLKRCPTPLLVNRASRFLGRISYSVYLLHFLVLGCLLQPFEALTPPRWHEHSLPGCLALFVYLTAATIPLAWVTYRCVEQPCIGLGARWIRHLRTAGGNAPASREAAAGHLASI